MNPALILPLMMRTTRAGMSGISIPPAVSGGLQENQRLSEGAGNKGMQISANLSIDTREELAKSAGDQFRRFEGATYRGPCRSAAITLI